MYVCELALRQYKYVTFPTIFFSLYSTLVHFCNFYYVGNQKEAVPSQGR